MAGHDRDHDHNNDYDVDELDSAAVAAAMGFSSFGAQAPLNKKRRFNPQADAVIGTPRDGRPPARTQVYPAGTGANATKLPPRPVKTMAPATAPATTSLSDLPLHPPQPQNSAKMAMKLPPPTKTNTDEIDLDDDDDNNGEDDKEAGGANLETGGDADANDEPGPQYLDTSRPVGEIRDHLGNSVPENVEEDPVALQARIDAVVAAGNAAYGISPAAAAAAAQQLDGAVHSTSRHHGGIRPVDRHGFNPDLMPSAGPQFGAGDAAGSEAADSEMGDESSLVGSTDGRGQWQGRGGRGGRGGHGSHAHGGHQRDWWTGYYDPTSNENPWARIEQKLGLPTRGSNWLERDHGRVQKV
ncbi:hypothetical protein Sste5346_008124 [Sporothrix stenoceras]|uniref:Uncharacterized protein n=1 Tax=Sporothrix stenoceras TaxID=5173 RepID=A0ABR3YRW2_9PEZI